MNRLRCRRAAADALLRCSSLLFLAAAVGSFVFWVPLQPTEPVPARPGMRCTRYTETSMVFPIDVSTSMFATSLLLPSPLVPYAEKFVRSTFKTSNRRIVCYTMITEELLRKPDVNPWQNINIVCICTVVRIRWHFRHYENAQFSISNITFDVLLHFVNSNISRYQRKILKLFARINPNSFNWVLNSWAHIYFLNMVYHQGLSLVWKGLADEFTPKLKNLIYRYFSGVYQQVEFNRVLKYFEHPRINQILINNSSSRPCNTHYKTSPI